MEQSNDCKNIKPEGVWDAQRSELARQNLSTGFLMNHKTGRTEVGGLIDVKRKSAIGLRILIFRNNITKPMN